MKRLSVLLLLLAVPAAAQTVQVPDGNTLIIDGKTWRLWNVAAPEIYQQCDDGWQVGQESVRFLRGLINGHTLACEPRGKDRLQRPVLQCRADGIDIGESMIRAGLAWALPGHAGYADLEHNARYDRRGAHDHTCELPLSIQQAPRR